MALTHVVTSTPAFNQTNVAPTVPAEAVAGDHAFLVATAKQQAKDFDPATFGSWTLLFTGLLGTSTGANTAGQGSIRMGVFYRTVPPEGLGTPTIGITGAGTGSATLVSGTLSIWRSDTGATLSTATASGADITAATGWSVTADVDPGLESGDALMMFSAVTDDLPRFNAFSAAATGATISALTELADAGSSVGDDTAVGLHAGTVTAGPATAPPVFTATMSTGAGSTGGTVFVRFREVGGGTPLPPSGSGTGTWGFTGTAAGSTPAGPAIPVGTAAGSWSFTGAATGNRAPKATGTGSWSFTGTASGKRTPKGSATGSFAFTGAASGKSTRRGSASGTAAWAGAATGAAPVVGASDGTAAGTWAYTGTATGARTSRGAAAGTTAYVGTASGTAPVVGSKSGTATGTVAWSGTAAGKRAPKASAAGTTAYVGTASGITARTGTATGAWLYVGTAVGRTPTVGRDITVTVGGLTARTLTGDLTTHTLDGDLRARTLTATLED